MKLGIYGGAFNPPHLGHIRAAVYGAQALGLSKVLLMPTCVSPHKQAPQNSASAQDRLEMLRISAREHPCLEVSDMEISRGGQSYTYETVLQLKRENPQAELVLFMGTDMFASLLNWKNPHIILDNASIGVFYRGDRDEVNLIEKQKKALTQLGATVYLIENPVTQVSSTALRMLLTLGCAQAYLPDGVWKYIYENALYGTGESLKNLPLPQLEKVACSLLKPERVSHVLGCRDMALQLAKRWGVDETDAHRAALLHDATKALNGAQQLTLCEHWGILLDNFEKDNPLVLHAITGSVAARKVFGENDAVVSAIASHTTGKPYMSTLNKIIYLADNLEPTRNYSGVEQLRELAFTDLNEAMRQALRKTLVYLKEKGGSVHPDGEKTLVWLEEMGQNGE